MGIDRFLIFQIGWFEMIVDVGLTQLLFELGGCSCLRVFRKHGIKILFLAPCLIDPLDAK